MELQALIEENFVSFVPDAHRIERATLSRADGANYS